VKTKNSSAAPRDSTQGVIRYCNFYLEFPDGEVWHDSAHIAGGLYAWATNVMSKTDPEVGRALLKKGEFHRKHPDGTTHRWVVSDTPVEHKWGLNKGITRVSGT
jgi:hypothetical protein